MLELTQVIFYGPIMIHQSAALYRHSHIKLHVNLFCNALQDFVVVMMAEKVAAVDWWSCSNVREGHNRQNCFWLAFAHLLQCQESGGVGGY